MTEKILFLVFAIPLVATALGVLISRNPVYAAIIPRSYDVAPDGKRYLVIEDATRSQEQRRTITVVSGWGEELKRLLPNRAQR